MVWDGVEPQKPCMNKLNPLDLLIYLLPENLNQITGGKVTQVLFEMGSDVQN